MPKRNTTSNLIEMTEFLHKQRGNNVQTDVVYFDYSKAFDKIDHHLLASKLVSLSMPLLPFLTVMNFITNRTYQLKVNNGPSGERFTSHSSVPQGSHCGPLLFATMCHDTASCIDNSDLNVLLYADDTKFYKVIKSMEDEERLQQAIDKLTRWTKDESHWNRL